MITQDSAYYTPYFCEENIWQLGRYLIAQQQYVEDFSVLLLSNHARQIPLLQQRLAAIGQAVIWDYHVILYQHTPTPYIYDLDSRLPCPVPFNIYYQYTFPAPKQIPNHHLIQVRVIPLAAYLTRFHSDRHHMRNAAGEALTPFPTWRCILTSIPRRIDLFDYMDMTRILNDGSQVCLYTNLQRILKQQTRTCLV